MIKKYPNRRLYDTTESRYITRADVQKMVIDRIDFVVVDKTTKEDITRTILLQIISQQEETQDPMMSRDFLSRVIRSHDRATNGMTASFLEQSLKLLTTHIEGRAMGTEADVWDSAAVGGLAEQNYQRWRSVQEKICQTLDAAQLPPPAMVIDRPAHMPIEAGAGAAAG
jgi:polyhydroxyalkanoate synthesis repressor PhaR